MRIFVAVELPQSVRDAAQNVAIQIERRLDPRIKVRWVSADQMHLTVRFIGHVSDERVPALLAVLDAPLPIPPFDVELAGCGVFPKSGLPRVFWIGLTEGLEPLQRMHEEFNRRLLPLGFEAEDRPFSAHLTLGRVKDAPASAARGVREMLRATPTPHLRAAIKSATVFRSVLSSKGSTYEPLLHVRCSSAGE